MEFSPKVSSNLFRVSFVFAFEPPVGIKASMQRSYAQMILGPRTERNPVSARAHLHFLLAFLHAVILERRRYTPFGWSKGYEFSDADQLCALEVIDQWVDIGASGNWNVGPNDALPETVDPISIPFEAIRTLLRDTVYGGRVDNEVDKRALASLIEYIFRPEAFESDFPLARGYKSRSPREEDVPALIAPDLGRAREHYTEYIENMRSDDVPLWVGLAPRADRLISARHGVETLAKWLTLHSKSAEDLFDLLPSGAPSGTTRSMKTRMVPSRKLSASLGWLAELKPKVVAMLHMLPEDLRPLERSQKSVEDPMFRCFDREVTSCSRLLQMIRSQLQALEQVCEGQSKFTNTLRCLARDISSGLLASEWISSYKTVAGLSLVEWLSDFCKRVAQMGCIGSEFGGGSMNPDNPQVKKYAESVLKILGGKTQPNQRLVWLGGLQFPNAFLTATRQAVAQKLKSSLDDLHLVVDIGEAAVDEQSFIVGGITLENASWDQQQKTLLLTDTLAFTLPPLRLRWVPSAHVAAGENRVPIPLFLTTDRTVIITMVNLPVPNDGAIDAWHQRGVALIVWTRS